MVANLQADVGVDNTMAEIDSFIEKTADERLADYLEFLRIPSIGTLHAHDADTQAAAEFLVQRLRKMGFEHVEASPTGRHPIVYADWLHAEGAPTILVYTHYDVQPVDPLYLWNKPPFDPVIENGRVYARGAADDKSHAHMHLWAARAWLETQGRLPVNLRHRLRRGGGVRLGPLRSLDRGQQAPTLRGPGDDQRHRLLRGQQAGHHRRPARARLHADRRNGVEAGPALRLLRRQRPEPGQCTGHDHREAQER